MMLISHPSPNFNDRPDDGVVDMLVLHYTGMQTGVAALERLCDPSFEVSAHYLVEEDGRIFQMVDESKRAWHAGVAFWRGNTDINSRSVGIEIVNPGHEWGYRAFPDAQILALVSLCKDILGRHAIPARNVVGHSDVAPARKQDPGELFPWEHLAQAGIGLWPKETPAPGDVGAMLAALGYDMADPGAAMVAFQRHYCPEELGKPEGSLTGSRLAGLLSQGTL